MYKGAHAVTLLSEWGDIQFGSPEGLPRGPVVSGYVNHKHSVMQQS